jgi:predicted dehydrogenase
MVVPSTVFGANDKIRVAIVGLGGRGAETHATAMQNQDDVEVVAECDPDRNRLKKAAAQFKKWYGRDVDQYTDMRNIMKRTDIDVVSIANQAYWHGLSTIWACQAGKHVYVEKPLSRYIWEGRQMVNAARQHDRIVQCGTQHRASTAIRDAIQWTREGHLGKIKHITCFAIKPRESMGKRDKPMEIPETIDYELWCGPAKKLPIYRNELQYACRWDWNTGGGETLDQGVHELDVARWWLGERRMPRRTMSIGGRFLWDDAGDTPNAHIMCYDFPTAPVVHEMYNVEAPAFVDGLKLFGANGTRVQKRVETMLREGPYGLVVEYEEGSVIVQPYEAHFTCLVHDRQGKEIKSFSGGSNHFVNFIQAVRSGRREDLNAEVEEGHTSTSCPNTSNISYRLGEVASVKQQRAQIDGIPCFNESFDRFLTVLEGHDIDPNTATLGPWLEIDRSRECIKDDNRANELVLGTYRESFKVPDLSI